jgi:hypothetical protein
MSRALSSSAAETDKCGSAAPNIRAVTDHQRGDAWAFLQSGLVRSIRWLAAVAIVALSWLVQGSSHDGAEVIYPLVLAGLMFAPDVRKFKFTTPFGDAEGEVGDQARATVTAADASAIEQAKRSSQDQGEATPLADLARDIPS